VHHRAVLSRPGVWIVVDRVRGTGLHRGDLHWHLDPAWKATRAGTNGAVRVQHPDGTAVWIVSLDADCDLFNATTDGSGLGWCAPVYGRLEPTTTIRMRKEDDAPFSLVTAIVDSVDPPVLELSRVTGPGEPIGLTIRTAAWIDTAVFTRCADDGGEPRGLWRLGGFVTNARMACWRESSTEGQLETIAVVDGTIARGLADVDATASEPVSVDHTPTGAAAFTQPAG
jgi:hypothetical protein